MDWTGTIVEVAISLASMALLGGLGVFFAWAKGNTKSERLKSALDMLEKAAAATVGELQQTTVEKYKAASADGKLTKEEIDELKRDSLALVMKRMGTAAQDVIMGAGLDLEDRIKAEVEATITAMKGFSFQAGTALESLE